MVYSKLGIFGNVFFGGRREQIWGELRCFAHVACNLHLALHEGNLRVELAQANFLEVIVCHRESCISLGGLTGLAHSLAVLQINLVDQGWLGALLCSNLEAEDSVHFGNKSLTVTTSQVS